MAEGKTLLQQQAEMLITSLSSQRSQQDHTDAVIICEGQEFPVHRIVLNAGSCYFATMFRTDMLESATGRVELRGVDAKTLGIVLDFLYCKEIGNIEEDEEKLKSVLCASHLLRVDLLYTECWVKLRSKVTSTNFLDAWNLAARFQNEAVSKWVLDLIVKNFRRAVNSTDFLLLSAVQLKQILDHPGMTLVATETVLQAVLNWGRLSQVERAVEVTNILSQFSSKFQKLTNSFIAGLLTDPFVHSLLEVLPQVLEISADRLLTSSTGSRPDTSRSLNSLNKVGKCNLPKGRDNFKKF